jgi:pyruvate carboxylase
MLISLSKNAIHQEIAIRVFRTAHELSMRTVAIFSNEDRLSMHRYKVRKAGTYGIGPGFWDRLALFCEVGAFGSSDVASSQNNCWRYGGL